eukprot:1765537-Pleurochrysis_carterae.AAC.1
MAAATFSYALIGVRHGTRAHTSSLRACSRGGESARAPCFHAVRVCSWSTCVARAPAQSSAWRRGTSGGRDACLARWLCFLSRIVQRFTPAALHPAPQPCTRPPPPSPFAVHAGVLGARSSVHTNDNMLTALGQPHMPALTRLCAFLFGAIIIGFGVPVRRDGCPRVKWGDQVGGHGGGAGGESDGGGGSGAGGESDGGGGGSGCGESDGGGGGGGCGESDGGGGGGGCGENDGGGGG